MVADATNTYCTMRPADQLVFCHEAMHLQLRMQDAGWAADVERWECDSDGDASAEC